MISLTVPFIISSLCLAGGMSLYVKACTNLWRKIKAELKETAQNEVPQSCESFNESIEPDLIWFLIGACFVLYGFIFALLLGAHELAGVREQMLAYVSMPLMLLMQLTPFPIVKNVQAVRAKKEKQPSAQLNAIA